MIYFSIKYNKNDEKKKILFLITDFSGGGAENVFVKLANFCIKI